MNMRAIVLWLLALAACSGNGNGNGTATPGPERLRLEGALLDRDPASGQMVVYDWVLKALFELNPVDGTGSVVSDSGHGTGPQFGDVYGLTVDGARNRALLVDASAGAILAVDLATGDRSILSDAGHGNGAPFVGPYTVAIDAAAARALVLDTDSLRAVDLLTGDRTTLASGFITPVALTLLADGHTALVADWGDDGLYPSLSAVDLPTGSRTVVFDVGQIGRTRRLVTVPGSGAVLAADFDAANMFFVDPGVPTTVLVSGAARGAGPPIPTGLPNDLALDLVHGGALVFSREHLALLRVDFATGDRRVVGD